MPIRKTGGHTHWNLFTRTVMPEVLDWAFQLVPGPRNAFALAQLTLPYWRRSLFRLNSIAQLESWGIRRTGSCGLPYRSQRP